MKKNTKRWFICLSSLIAIGLMSIFSINQYVQKIGMSHIVEADNAPQADAILILGARVYSNGNVSLMLKDRLTAGYELYKQNKAEKILVSGDHGRKNYDEVNTMKTYLKDKGIPTEDVFMDHAGFSNIRKSLQSQRYFSSKKGYYCNTRVSFDESDIYCQRIGARSIWSSIG